MEGYHGTVFAYGMTGTGKTFSMQVRVEHSISVDCLDSFFRILDEGLG